MSYLDTIEMFLGYKLSHVEYDLQVSNVNAGDNCDEFMVKNLINHLKILHLNNNEDNLIESITNNGDLSYSNNWITCHESFSHTYRKLNLNFRLPLLSEAPQLKSQKCFTNYENLIKFLDSREPKTILVEVQMIVGRFDELSMRPQTILHKLNSLLFNNYAAGLLIRWGNCKKYFAYCSFLF